MCGFVNNHDNYMSCVVAVLTFIVSLLFAVLWSLSNTSNRAEEASMDRARLGKRVGGPDLVPGPDY